jgi:site-specific DNA-adenine methylase
MPAKPLSVLAWYGGKGHMLDDIYPFPPHDLFVDVFGGGGSVLMNKPRSVKEVYNDINGRLVNFFRVLQNQWMELEFLVHYKCPFKARELFEKYKEVSEDSLEDAVRFFYVNTMGYSGLNNTLSGLHNVESRNFQTVMENKIKRFPEIAKRFKGVVIEQEDFRQIIKRFDGPNSLLFCDPPYVSGGVNYQKMSGNSDITDENDWTGESGENLYGDLWDLLLHLQGKFVLTFDIIPEPLADAGFFIQPVERYNYSASSADERSTQTEYIIRNFTNSLIKQKTATTKSLSEFMK